MIRSMTGYGRAQEQIDGRDILVEIKSVNSRYLEQNVRIGRNYTYLEEELKSLVKSRISRGKAEIAVSVNLVEGKKADIRVNDELIMKKPHPCGDNRFLVLRVGMDFKIRCQKCGREVMVPRKKVERNIRKVMRNEE